MSERRYGIAMAVIVGISTVGFLRATRVSDYDLEPPLTIHAPRHDPGPPPQRRYAELRAKNVRPTTDVATACTDCHPERIPEEGKKQRTEHPIGIAPPAGARLQSLLAAGGRLSVQDDGTLHVGCRTCHRPHSADQDARLVVTADDGALCLSCHTANGPDHSRHPVAIPLDPATRARVEAIGGTTTEHGLSCLSCHDPHASTARTLLRTDGAGATACATCHPEQRRTPPTGGHGEAGCVGCHGMHRPPNLPEGVHAEGVGPQLCLDCHTSRGARPRLTLAASHPLGLPLAPGSYGDLGAHEGRLACLTCHDPHSGEERLLRDAVGPLCTTCHADKDAVLGTDHDASVVPTDGTRGACLSCHRSHGTDAPYLVPTRGADENPAVGRCLRCHDGSTEATAVAHHSHPKGLLLTVAGLPFRYDGPVPYYDASGERTQDRAAGEITCSTCHDPHRWKHDAVERPGAANGSEQNSFLRDPEDISRFCTVCHGVDGRPRFRFFHTERFRGSNLLEP